MDGRIAIVCKGESFLRALVNLLCLSTLIIASAAPALNAQGQSDTLNTDELLESMGIHPYPKTDELRESRFPEDWLQVEPLFAEDVNESFSNFDDLAWLEEIAQKNKVFLLGENHYYQTIQNLRNRILFALNTYDRYHLLVIEHQYSISGYLDHYIGMTDDSEAKDFYENVIYDLVGTEEMYVLLEHLRRWNNLYPDRRIHIGANDVEHDYINTLARVVIPYFQSMDSSFTMDFERITTLDLEVLLEDLETRLKKAKNENLVGEYSFLTPQYIERVLENLRSLFMCHRYDFMYYRQRAMIRNLTNPRFFGRYLRNGKVIIHAGGYHTPTHFPYPDGGNFYREGSYLSFDFEATKGKTYSLFINGLAYQIGSMAQVDLDSCLHHGSGYNQIVKKFQGAYKQKLVSPDSFYLFNWKMDEFDNLVFTAAYRHDHSPMLVKYLDWDNIIETASGISRGQYNAVRTIKDSYYDRYDAVIIVPRSPITRVKRKINL